MSISNTTSKISYTGDGSTVTFSFPFKIFNTSQMVVEQVQPNGTVISNYVLGVDYTVSINPIAEGGSVTWTVAPALNNTIVLARIVSYTQTVVLATEGALPALQISNQLDLMTMMVIQLVGSNLQIQTSFTGTIPAVLPNPVAGEVLMWDPTGMFLISSPGIVGPQGPVGPMGGGVSNVSSANGDISVASPTTTPILTLNSGSGANQIVKRDSAGDIEDGAYADYSGSSTIVGFASMGTVYIYTKKVGKTVFVNFEVTGVSNSTSLSFTLPYAAGSTGGIIAPILAMNNSSRISGAAAIITGGSAVVNCYIDYGGDVWTNSGNKQALGQFVYQSA